MSKYFVFTNILGSHAFDERLQLVESGPVKVISDRYGNAALPKDKIKEAIRAFKRSEFYSTFRKENIKITKQKIRENVKGDLLAIQANNAIDDINVSINTLGKRLREWYELYSPEVSWAIASHEKFSELILHKDREVLLKDLGIDSSDTMGADIAKSDLDEILALGRSIMELYDLRKRKETYLDKLMQATCPNVSVITGSSIAAKLLGLAGSLERLSELPSSTIQLLGAEKALFRHRKTGARPPKHGIIVQHTYFTKIRSKDYGRLARLLADKISIAAKVDFFKGRFVGDDLKAQIESKLGGFTR